MRAGAGMRRHLNESHASLPCNGAAESFVSFIPLFDGVWIDAQFWAAIRGRILVDNEKLSPATRT